MNTLQLDEQTARKLYPESSGEFKNLLEEKFTKEFLSMDPADRIKSYEDACKDQKIEPLTLKHFSFLPKEDQEAQFAFHQLTIINRAINGAWKANYDNESQRKWGAWLLKKEAGFAFSGTYFDHTITASDVGSRLCSDTEKHAKYVAETFPELFNKLFL